MGWRDAEYTVVPVADPRVEEVVHTLRVSHANGGVILRVFRPVNESTFDSASRTDLQGTEYWLRCFLEAESIRDAVPELKIPYPLPHVPKHVWYSAFEFEGAVTHSLLAGGAYVGPAFSEEVARQRSRDFVDALVGDERLSTVVYRIDEPWTDWFYDVAWDSTFVLFQSRARRWVLFCMTDTD